MIFLLKLSCSLFGASNWAQLKAHSFVQLIHVNSDLVNIVPIPVTVVSVETEHASIRRMSHDLFWVQALFLGHPRFLERVPHVPKGRVGPDLTTLGHIDLVLNLFDERIIIAVQSIQCHDQKVERFAR